MILPRARREAGWLLYDAPVPEGTPLQRVRDRQNVAASLLGSSASLPAGCKFAWVGASELRVRAEQPEPPEALSASRRAALAAGFAAAADPFSAAVAVAAHPDAVETSKDAPAAELATLCRESGWLFEERSDGALIVDLGVSGCYLPALIESRAAGIAIETRVVSRLPNTGVRRAAVSALLLRANGAFRMVRAVFRRLEGEDQALLEAPLPADASADEFGMALGAVAVAAQHCAVEAQKLAADDRLSRVYSNHWRLKQRPAAVPEHESSVQAQT